MAYQCHLKRPTLDRKRSPELPPTLPSPRSVPGHPHAPRPDRGLDLSPEDLQPVTSILEAATVALSATTAAGAAATVLLNRSRRTLTRERDELATRSGTQEQLLRAAGARETVLRDEVRHLLKTRLPARALSLISDHYSVPGLLHNSLVGTEFAKLLDAVQDLFASTVLEERGRIDSAARTALRGACTEIQAKAYQLQNLVVSLQRECQDEKTLDDLFKIDHFNEQIARLVQKAAIVTGGWPGQVRLDTHLPDVVTGAKSRLHGYDRIQITSRLLADNVGVVGPAAEPLAVVCAELMANALESSRGDLSVEVTILQTDNGAVSIQIDDAGKGMTAEVAARGTRLVSGKNPQGVLLTELGDPPALGLAAIGQLVADHGFHVSVDQVSSYSGVRAVVSVPPALLTVIDDEAEPLSAMAPLPSAAPLAPRRPAAPETSAPVSDPHDGSGLPQRRRRARPASAVHDRLPQEAQPPDPETAFADWDAYEKGMAAGHAGDSAPTDTETDTKDKS
ncbi:ATP-binding protein [Streptomyces sp. NPDC004237]|uniref:ATP-binding protein n=1 Tax=Streptomyces sp. NPDC004237 TaxID=3154455 RepID=UPI0033BD0B7F